MNESAEAPADSRGNSNFGAIVVALGAQLRPAIVGLVLLTLITGCIFPLGLFGLGRTLFPDQAAGSLATRGGVIVGSRLIGQSFIRPEYFQPRPLAAGPIVEALG
jgi:K+-transporting ATPase c subunit